MSCTIKGIVGRVAETSAPRIVQGSVAFVVTQLRYADGQNCGGPYALDDFVGATAQFPSAADADTPINVVGTLVSADRGEVRFALPASGTALIAAGEPISFQQIFEDDTGVNIIRFDDALNVVESLF